MGLIPSSPFSSDRIDTDYTSNTAPIVIGGCGRSGTTLLRVMLDSHRHICCGPESDLFRPVPIQLERLHDWFELPGDTITEIFRTAGSRAEFTDLFFQAFCERMGKRRWAEKTPRNVLFLSYIFRAFPRARFLHMIRDGRDVACSLRTHPRHKVVAGKLVPLNTWNPIEPGIHRWVEAITAAAPYRDDPRYMAIGYEELVLQPRATLERVLSFIEEPWDEAVLDYHAIRSPSRDISKFPQNPEATYAIYNTSIGRWRRDFTPRDRAVFKLLAGKILVELSYAETGDW